MALIAEDGNGRSDAESFASVDFADTYHQKRDNMAWAALPADEKEAALRKATDYLMLAYGERWKGERQYREQALDWPRYAAMVDGYEVGYDDVPRVVQNATVSLALRASTDDIVPDIAQQVKRERVEGVVEVEYQPNSTAQVRYREIDGMLRRYLRSGAHSVPIVLG